MSPRRTSLKITGRVQGVFYRDSAQSEARRLGLSGFVRNLKDGSVQAVAEGKPEDVEAFIAWCKKGPPAAQVDSVAVSEEPATGEFASFVVLR